MAKFDVQVAVYYWIEVEADDAEGAEAAAEAEYAEGEQGVLDYHEIVDVVAG